MRTIMPVAGLVIAIAVAAAGCTTHLDAVRMRTDAVPPVAGAPYFLNFTQFTVTVSRRLRCEDVSKKEPFAVAIAIEVAHAEARDPKRAYVIDLASLQSALKASDVEVEYYDDGTLKSLNAAAEDRSGEVLKSAVATLGKLAVAGVAFGAPKAGPPSACSKEVRDAQDAVARLTREIAEKTAQLDNRTVQLERVTTLSAAVGKDWPVADRRKFAAEIDAVYQDRVALRHLQDALKAEVQKVTVTSTTTWPPDGETFVSDAATIPDLDLATLTGWGANANDASSLQAMSRVFLKIEPTGAFGRKDPCGEACKDDAIKGLKYRMPVPGRLVACTTPDCAAGERIDSTLSLISQLGPIFVLSLDSVPFSNRKITATFAQSGLPTKLGVQSITASGETAATSIGAAVDSALDARTKLVSTPLERLQAETALLKARKEFADAQAALAPPASDPQADATRAFGADAALARAELTSLQARTAIEAARRRTDVVP